MPDVDTEGMAILGRMRWITLTLRPSIEAVFERNGVDAGTFDVISTLLRSGPPYRLRPTELYDQLMISSGGLTDRLRRLERSGLVVRVPSDEDGRSILVQLTDHGKTLTERVFREDMAVEAAMLTNLSKIDRDKLAQLLRKLALTIEPQGVPTEIAPHASSSTSQ